ncbi:valine--pyruvate transaminase [Halioxenophilus sp. WMMB6]|uniref:valine--pyruvate transaminase n=1 Tax=Halioxenophilus sp. WMMB6 TaxID=3073815 RepID=UPI00295E6939|nr:valine--pyruvate transaminase [Halioxenophilus sp. WMMB6]
MNYKLSKFGERFCAPSGTFTLMDDLGKALTTNPDMLFLGGGNPAQIPAVEAEIVAAIEALLASPGGVQRLCGNYQSPQGDPAFLEAMAAYLQRNCGWPVTAENIALANGSQAAFFVLFNMLAGEFDDDNLSQILLPMAPEYIGYASSGLSDNFFVSQKPLIEPLADGQFKYHIDFDNLPLNDAASAQGIGAICLSRPTNPTGNVIGDDELEHLRQLAKARNIPIIIDAAYGLPFPGILFTQADCPWDDGIIYLMSLSKLGLPGVRTGIVVASREIIAAYTRANTALNLACSSAGPALTRPWFEDDRVNLIGRTMVQPFYEQACQTALRLVRDKCADLPVRVHAPQGAIFLWLWCENLPISSEELYQRLKARGVLVLSGHHFFIGIDTDWPHAHECLRITYCQSETVLEQAITLLAEELRSLYQAD